MPVDPKTFLLIHVILGLVGMFAGLVVLGGLMAGVRFSRWVGLFLATTVLTSATGFGIPFAQVLPSHIVGALSLLVLLAQLFAKIPAMAMLSPSPAAPVFAVTQGFVLVLFIVLGAACVKGFRNARL